jgi:2'-5' RNA ligase
MAIAVTLCLDTEAAAQVESLCATLADRGISDYAARLGYRPHVTLVRGTEIDMAAVLPALRDFTAALKEQALCLNALSVFPGVTSVLWLALSDNPALRSAQATLHKAISPFLTDEVYSAPRTWIPHVTLAEGLTDAALEAALDVLAPSFSSINGELNRLELVHFPPVHVEWGSSLRAASKKIGSVT